MQGIGHAPIQLRWSRVVSSLRSPCVTRALPARLRIVRPGLRLRSASPEGEANTLRALRSVLEAGRPAHTSVPRRAVLQLQDMAVAEALARACEVRVHMARRGASASETGEGRTMSDDRPSDLDRGRALIRALAPTTQQMHYIVVDGPPTSKARARYGKGRMYVDTMQRAAESALGWQLKAFIRRPLTGNLAIGCIFYRPNYQRIDVDNLLKHVLDSANGVCWEDDSQVTAILGVAELDRQNPRTVIVIGEHISSLRRDEGRYGGERKCPLCGKRFTRRSNAPHKRFCSRRCASISNGHDLAEKVTCEQCGASFRRRTYDQKLCSDACRRARLTAVRKLPPATCVDCGEPVSKRGYVRCRSCWRAASATRTMSR